jgi:hypothetical protein
VQLVISSLKVTEKLDDAVRPVNAGYDDMFSHRLVNILDATAAAGVLKQRILDIPSKAATLMIVLVTDHDMVLLSSMQTEHVQSGAMSESEIWSINRSLNMKYARNRLSLTEVCPAPEDAMRFVSSKQVSEHGVEVCLAARCEVY